jgi:hypothetical protein
LKGVGTCLKAAGLPTYALGINQVVDSEPRASFDEALAMAAPKPEPPVMIATLCSQVSRVSTRPSVVSTAIPMTQSTLTIRIVVERQQLVGSIWGGAG